MYNIYFLATCAYVALILWFTILMRLFFSALRANEWTHFIINRTGGYWGMEVQKERFSRLPFNDRYWDIFWGNSLREPYPDYWYNTIIGTIEVVAFPYLMHFHKFPFIGFWLTFKLIGQWNMWTVNRNAANRIVIATALQLGYSYFILMPILGIIS